MQKIHKAYVAGRISRQAEVQKIIAALKAVGVEITRDWVLMSERLQAQSITSEEDARSFRQRSYAELKPEFHVEAEADLQAVIDADIFIILTDELGSSMYVEMGAAFAANKLQGKPKYLYAIGPHFDRMLFYQHQAVKRVDSIEGIIEDLKKNGLI